MQRQPVALCKVPPYYSRSSVNLNRHDAKMSDKHWQWLLYILLLCGSIVILVTFLDYGLTWDEEVQRNYGELVLRWYGSLFRDRSALGYQNLNLYGAFFEVIAQLVVRLSPFGVYETRHLVTALFGVLAIATTYRLGAFVSDPMGGFFSALFLTLTPVFYGHQFNNSKDIPFLTLSLLAFYFILQSYDSLPRLPRRLIVKIGVSLGLTLGIRAGGIFLFGYLALLWACWLTMQWLSNRSKSQVEEVQAAQPERPNGLSSLKTIAHLSLSFALISLIAWVVMLVWWPWAQIKPLVNPFRALAQTAHFSTGLRVFHGGQYVPATDLPASYLPTWFAISMPEFYFISLVAGLFLAYQFARRFAKTPGCFDRIIKIGMLIFGFCFPPTMAILMHSTLYNGLRHFLFVIPILAVLAGISFAALFKPDANRVVKAVAAALVVLSMGSTVFDMVQLHPYQYIYFNRTIAGGLKNAAERYETDYWGMSYREGVEWVIKNYRPDAQEQIRVANCSKLFLTGYFLEKAEETRQRFRSVRSDEDPHLFLAISRCHRKRERQIVHTVERQGAPLMNVIELKQPD